MPHSNSTLTTCNIDKWYYIITYNACFAIITNEHGIIVDGAPIVKKEIGKRFDDWKRTMGSKIKSITPLTKDE